MRTRFRRTIWAGLLCGCVVALVAEAAPPVITAAAGLDRYIGTIVTLQGVVTPSKIPMILGVDVASDTPDLRGKTATATGTLVRWTVTMQEIRARTKKEGAFAHRGPGTFYKLVDGKGALVQVQPMRAP